MSGEEVLRFDDHDTTVSKMYEDLESEAGDNSYIIAKDGGKAITRQDIMKRLNNLTLAEVFGRDKEITINFIKQPITKIEDDVIKEMQEGVRDGVSSIEDMLQYILPNHNQNVVDIVKKSQYVASEIVKQGLNPNILNDFELDKESKQKVFLEYMSQIGEMLKLTNRGISNNIVLAIIDNILPAIIEDLIPNYLDKLSGHGLSRDQLENAIQFGFNNSKSLTPSSSTPSSPAPSPRGGDGDGLHLDPVEERQGNSFGR